MTTKQGRSPADTVALQRRRVPSQGRARLTVDSIVQAAQQLLDEDGPQALTTRRIAERAGVSIGSLYQYFPNREAIVVQLFEPILQAAARRGSLRYENDLATEDFFVEAYRGQIELVKQLVDIDEVTFASHQKYLMWDWVSERLGMSPQRRRRNIQSFLSDRLPERSLGEVEVASFLLGIGVPSMIDSLALESPKLLDEHSLHDKLADIIQCALRTNVQSVRGREKILSGASGWDISLGR